MAFEWSDCWFKLRRLHFCLYFDRYFCLLVFICIIEIKRNYTKVKFAIDFYDTVAVFEKYTPFSCIDTYVMEQLFRRDRTSQPTPPPHHRAPTPDRQLFTTSSKEEERGIYKTKHKLVIGHQKYKNDKSVISAFYFFIGIKSMLVMNNASKMCICVKKKKDRKNEWTNEPGHQKMCLMSYANNKGADQPAHPRSLISAFVVRCWDSIISLDSIAEI